MAGAAKSLAAAGKIQADRVVVYETIQKVAASPTLTAGGNTSVLLSGAKEPIQVTSAGMASMKSLVADCGKGMAKIVSVLPNERSFAKGLHFGEIISILWLAHEIYDTFYVGTAHVPSSFTAEDIAAVCVGSKIRKLAVEEMTKCKALSEDALAGVALADGELLSLFQSAAKYNVTSEEMNKLSGRYLTVSLTDQ